jgi:hypothetical protein
MMTRIRDNLALLIFGQFWLNPTIPFSFGKRD